MFNLLPLDDMFDFKQEYRFENDFIILKPLEEKDYDELLACSQHPEIWTHFTEQGLGQDKFNTYFMNAIQQRQEANQYPFIIIDRPSGKITGMTRVYDLNNTFRTLKIGHTWISPEFQGTYVNKASKYLLFEFIFDNLIFERIGFGASALNTHSIKAMQSIGCHIEGKLRNFLPGKDDNIRIDIILLSILREEWRQSAQAQLFKKLQSFSID